MRAYAYLRIPHPEKLDGDARKRIATIQQFSELGSGFQIATLDTEVCGARNLLGATQSGHMHTVGYEVFLQMLEEAVRELRPDSPVWPASWLSFQIPRSSPRP